MEIQLMLFLSKNVSSLEGSYTLSSSAATEVGCCLKKYTGTLSECVVMIKGMLLTQ
jgi:hypothetical protein